MSSYCFTFYFRYQARCDELEVANKEFKGKYDQMDQDRKANVAYLKKNLEARGNV